MHVLSRLAATILIAGGMAAGPATAAHASGSMPSAAHVSSSAQVPFSGQVPCDSQCQAQWDQQRQNALPRTNFYNAPSPLPFAPAGSVIRQQVTSDYVVNGKAVTATRMLYHSRTSAGRDVAASAVVLAPSGHAPRGGWPIVADAHGSSGFGVDCAPSLMRDLYHGNQMMAFVARGWAVVAPDYAGLGTTGRDEFVNKTAESNDIIDAVRAARHARTDLSQRWVVWGHSQGGGATLAVAERQAVHPQPGYLGAVVTSPAADLTATVPSVVATPGMGGFVPMIALGAKVTDPRINLATVLSKQAIDALSITRSGCLGVVMSVYGGMSNDDLVRPDYLDGSRFARYLADNSTGTHPVGGPVLLLQGEADYAVPRTITDHVVAGLCDHSARLDYRTYPGLGHDTMPGVQTGIDDGAMPDILAWTADRFAGKPAKSTCA